MPPEELRRREIGDWFCLSWILKRPKFNSMIERLQGRQKCGSSRHNCYLIYCCVARSTHNNPNATTHTHPSIPSTTRNQKRKCPSSRLAFFFLGKVISSNEGGTYLLIPKVSSFLRSVVVVVGGGSACPPTHNFHDQLRGSEDDTINLITILTIPRPRSRPCFTRLILCTTNGRGKGSGRFNAHPSSGLDKLFGG